MVEWPRYVGESLGSSPGRSANGSLVELVTISHCHCEGHGFESRTIRQIMGSHVPRLAMLLCKQRVEGSIPLGSTGRMV